jgi:hypothetical protein
MKEEYDSLAQGVDFDPGVEYRAEQQNSLCPPRKNISNYYNLICAVSLYHDYSK